MNEHESVPYHRYVPVWGLFLLFLGIVFLLQTFNILPWRLWGTLWRFWPVLIICFGLGILLRRFNVWLISLLVLVLLFGSLGIAISMYEQPESLPTGDTTAQSRQTADSLEKADIVLDVSGTELDIGSLYSGSDLLAELTWPESEQLSPNRERFSREGTSGELYLDLDFEGWHSWDNYSNHWLLDLSPNLPLDLDVNANAALLYLDLTDLEATDISMDLDVGSCTIEMPEQTGFTDVQIDTALSSVEIFVPDETAARITVKSDLSSVNVDTSRFPRSNGVYQSPEYEESENQLDIAIDGDLCSIIIR